ncbi:MAG TPA: S46 family peptidase [Pyrinomonadaceae bacterium]|nr:S46 family peptidase [Pyrinomonadaceae bacterium]
MRHRKFLCTLILALFSLQTLNFSARADEGMWPFNNLPRAAIKKKYGFDITDAWLRKVQLASVRFNSGGSGSFVSADGLVMTNHHIASDVLQKISTPQKDYIKEGFYAATRDQEAKAPDLELNQLVGIEDVTARVMSAVKPDMTTAQANAARNAEINNISAEAGKKNGLRNDVIALYQGGQYNLYTYKKYTDVRLVFAPEFEIAFLGGDPDNFEYPRYDLDLALFRVYENDRPIHSANFFKWSEQGSKEGDLVFVSGNPGRTNRLDIVAHLEYLRDFGIPLLLKYLQHLHDMYTRYGALGAEQERRAHEDLFSADNSLKAYIGEEGAPGRGGLKDPSVISAKKKAEDELRKLVAANPKMQKEYGDAWETIAKERKELPSYERERRFLESRWGFSSDYFNFARTLVRMAEESAKPNAQRLPEYTDGNRESLEQELYSPAPIYDDFEKMKLANSLALMRDEMGANNDIVKRVLHGKTPEARAEELINGTKLKDVDARKQIAAGGQQAIASSDDPMIQLARSIDTEARAARKRYETEVIAVERTNYGKIARALFETKGKSMYPDATFTLRLSYGTVKGYKIDGKTYAPFTDLAGLWQHAREHGDKYPYHIPESWEKARSSLNLKTPLNFVSDADIIGGNSGSPVINRKGEIVGLIFDGNIQSLPGDFYFDGAINRAVSVDVRGMFEALRKVYHADAVVSELMR